MNFISAIIPAGGIGKRMGVDTPKQYLFLKNKPIISHTIELLSSLEEIKEIIIVCSQADKDNVEKICEKEKFLKVRNIVEGGLRRQDSVRNGFLYTKGDYVLIHDAVRPCVSIESVKKVIKDGVDFGCAILGVPVKATIKKVNDDFFVEKTLDRNHVWEIQTPQVFKKEILKESYTHISNFDKVDYTDESMIVEQFGHRVKIVEGTYTNIKITTPEDLIIAEKFYENRNRL